MTIRIIRPLVLLSALITTPVLANEAEDLLKSMQSAVHSLSYSGKLVFAKGNELAEYQIEHQPGQGNSSSETVIKLNKGDSAATSGAQQFSLINSSSLRLPDQQAYRIDLGGNAQVANHLCKVVVVRPKDKMRYLHRYCISPDTGMLLRYSVMNRQQQLLEQFMFTQLSVNAGAALQGQSAQPAVPQVVANLPSAWDFSDLPRGFAVNQVREIPGRNNAHQIILFDGLTFVSVFIEPGDVQVSRQKQLPASGATNIVTRKAAGHTITMVGEVPRETLQAIQNGLRHVGP